MSQRCSGGYFWKLLPAAPANTLSGSACDGHIQQAPRKRAFILGHAGGRSDVCPCTLLSLDALVGNNASCWKRNKLTYAATENRLGCWLATCPCTGSLLEISVAIWGHRVKAELLQDWDRASPRAAPGNHMSEGRAIAQIKTDKCSSEHRPCQEVPVLHSQFPSVLENSL